MKYIIIPILDRRIITVHDHHDLNNPFFVMTTDASDLRSTIVDNFSIQMNDCDIVVWEDNQSYVIGHCSRITEKIQADLLREDNHLSKLPQSIQNYINNLIKDDKQQQCFNFSQDPKDLSVIQTFTCINIEHTDLVCLVRDGWEKHFTFPWWTCELYETDVQWAIREVKEESQLDIEVCI